jgi:hypothetical protein
VINKGEKEEEEKRKKKHRSTFLEKQTSTLGKNVGAYLTQRNIRILINKQLKEILS